MPKEYNTPPKRKKKSEDTIFVALEISSLGSRMFAGNIICGIMESPYNGIFEA